MLHVSQLFIVLGLTMPTQKLLPLPRPRYRERGSTATGTDISWRGTQCNGVVLPISYNLTHREGVIEGMTDVVTPNFRGLLAKGTILNSPMKKVKQTFFGGGRGGTSHWNACGPGTENSIATIECVTELRYLAQYRYEVLRDVAGQLTYSDPLVDLESMKRHTGTKALAGVDNSTMQGLVTIGEMGKTIATLRNPVKALTDFTQKWRESRTLKRALNGGPKAVVDQYLTYYYGIKPIVLDVEKAIEAWLNEGNKKPRRTSRATAIDSKTQVTTEGGNPGNGFAWNTVTRVRKDEVSVRSGILYVVEHLASVRAEFGLRLSDIPGAALELTPWSFFANYFMNFNEIVGALTPRPGVEYLASWEVFKLTSTEQWISIDGGTNQQYSTRSPSTEYAGRIIEAAFRNPVPPHANVGLSAYKSRKILDWSVQKDLAILGLAFQQLYGIHAGIKRSVATGRNYAR